MKSMVFLAPPRMTPPNIRSNNQLTQKDYYSTKTKTKVGKSSSKRGVVMRDRSKNRKALQKGRSLSIEAIQTIQALKRARTRNDDGLALDMVFGSGFKRLLKLDMMAVLQELLRQNECLLALLVFEDVQKEHWYKPRVSLYAEIVSVLGSHGLYDKINLLFAELKAETRLEPDIRGFNLMMQNLINLDMIELAMQCFSFMKSLKCEPDRSSFRILIKGLESKGEFGLSAIIRQEAGKNYGQSLEFLEEEELVTSWK